jgi:hypothetical protein
MSLALDLYVQAFGSPRTERSWPYKNGAKAALQRIFEGERSVVPYAAGTPEFDAYVAGRQEGHRIAADHMQACTAWEPSGHLVSHASLAATAAEVPA